MSQLMVHIIPAFKGCFHLLGTKLSFLGFFLLSIVNTHNVIFISVDGFFCFLKCLRDIAIFPIPIFLTHMPFSAAMVAYLIEFSVFFSFFLLSYIFFIIIFRTSLISRFVTILITNLVPLLILLFANRLNY